MSLEEAEEDNIIDWKTKTLLEKLNALQELREIYYGIKNEIGNEFQTIYRILKQK